jgi:hypothetical protein
MGEVMAIEPGALAVILLYVLALIVVLVVSPRLIAAKGPTPWWKSVRFWSSIVALMQIVVYAVWG